MNAEKQCLEQEITALRLQLERAERQTKVDASRLNAEVISLRQRLDRADSDLLHSRRENLRLVDQVSSLDKEVRDFKYSTVKRIAQSILFWSFVS